MTMRIITYFVVVVLLVTGIAACVELRHLPAVIGIACALMHVLAAFAFLLPFLPIDGKVRIVSLVSVHLIAAVYWSIMSPAFDQRQIDEISHSVAGFTGPGDAPAFVEIPYVLVDSERQKRRTPSNP